MATKKNKYSHIGAPDFILDLDPKTDKLVRKALREFEGQITVLESAIGALVIGQHYGTRVLQLVHGQATIKKYEKVLGFQFAVKCPERGPLSFKSYGLNFVDKVGGFWKVVTGKVKPPEGKGNASKQL